MHVSAKYSYAWLPDRQMDRRWTKWSLCAAMLCRRHNKTGVFVKQECPQWQQSPKLAIFSIKVMVKVTRSLTFVSFKRVSLVSMHAKYEVSISYGSKVMSKIKVFFLPQSHRQTGQKIDAPKFHSGAIKILHFGKNQRFSKEKLYRLLNFLEICFDYTHFI